MNTQFNEIILFYRRTRFGPGHVRNLISLFNYSLVHIVYYTTYIRYHDFHFLIHYDS